MGEYALRLTNGTDTAPRMRQGDGLALQHDGPLRSRSGLRRDGGGEVTVLDGSMYVEVSPFSGWINGGVSGLQGGYPFVLDGTRSLGLADGDATLDRVDTIAAVVDDDSFDGSGATTAQVRVIQGTPGAGAPALPTTALALRDVEVPAMTSAGAGGLSSAMLGADRRQYLAGGIVPVGSVSERDAMVAETGQAVYRDDTDNLEVFNGTSWDTFVPLSATPLVQSGTTTITVTGSKAQATVTFPQPYGSTPAVVATVVDGDPTGDYIGTGARSTTSVDVHVAAPAATYTVLWVAVGDRP